LKSAETARNEMVTFQGLENGEVATEARFGARYHFEKSGKVVS